MSFLTQFRNATPVARGGGGGGQRGRKRARANYAPAHAPPLGGAEGEAGESDVEQHHHHSGSSSSSLADSAGSGGCTWELEELASRKREREELGAPQPRNECFGCVYDLSTDGVSICNESFKELCCVASQCIGQMSMEALGKELARLYEDFRRDMNARSQHEDRVPLPTWKASSIVEHLKYHNVDPEIQKWVRLVEIQEMINLTMESIMEIHPITEKRRVNKDSLRTYTDLVKLWYHVAERPMEKQYGYRKKGRLDIEVVNQPFITKHQKSIVDYYVAAQRQNLAFQ